MVRRVNLILFLSAMSGAAWVLSCEKATGPEPRAGDRSKLGAHPSSLPDASPDSATDSAAPKPSASAKRAPDPAAAVRCPDPAMIVVEGLYCSDVEHDCARWLENGGRYAQYRCAEYTKAYCLSPQRVPMRFCIDRDEWGPDPKGPPQNHVSYTDAARICANAGKRLCLESEWNFACEGEMIRPYPYGMRRDAAICNADRTDIFEDDSKKKLRDLREGPRDRPQCVSPFGVHHMTGNLEEWVSQDPEDSEATVRPAMKGGYWQPTKNHCRANQTAHDEHYKGVETGFRCCADPVSGDR